MKIQICLIVTGAMLAGPTHAQTSVSASSVSASSGSISSSANVSLDHESDIGKWSDAVVVIIHGPKVVTIHGGCRVDLWRVSRGDAVVWVLPTLLEAPQNMDWDTACVKKALEKSKGLLLSGSYTGVKGAPEELPHGQVLSDVVTPKTYARFKAVAWQFGDDPESLKHKRPGWAAYYLVGQAYSNLGLERQSYPSNLPGLARAAHVPIVNVRFDNGTSAERNVRNDLSLSEGDACMNADLDRIDYVENRSWKVIDAWKKGDLPTLVANFYDEGQARCKPGGGITQMSGNANIAIWTSAINKALDAGGTNVAAVPINWLLYKGGVLDQLVGGGASILPPKGLEN